MKLMGKKTGRVWHIGAVPPEHGRRAMCNWIKDGGGVDQLKGVFVSKLGGGGKKECHRGGKFVVFRKRAAASGKL